MRDEWKDWGRCKSSWAEQKKMLFTIKMTDERDFILQSRRNIFHWRAISKTFSLWQKHNQWPHVFLPFSQHNWLNFKNPARYDKACTLFQNSHAAKWHRHTQYRFHFAKGNRVKNTNKIIFIVEQLQSLASKKSHFLFFSGRACSHYHKHWSSKMDCLNDAS